MKKNFLIEMNYLKIIKLKASLKKCRAGNGYMEIRLLLLITLKQDLILEFLISTLMSKIALLLMLRSTRIAFMLTMLLLLIIFFKTTKVNSIMMLME